MSLNAGNIFAANKVAELQNLLTAANEKIAVLEKHCAELEEIANDSIIKRIRNLFS